MSAPVNFWRYYIPNENREGWAIVFVDSGGTFSVVSDFGNYGYRWTHHGCRDIREFLVDICGRDDRDYVLSKLAAGEQCYDGDATLRSIKDAIKDARRDGGFTRDDAREEWCTLTEEYDVDTREGFAVWLQASGTKLEEAWDHAVYVDPPQCVAFCARVLPRLAAILRTELTAEGYFTTGATP